MNPTLSKVNLSFSDGILSVQFVENTVIEVEDIIYIYDYGIQESHAKPYGLLFDSSTNHELSEEAIVYLAKTALQNNIIAIAYISKTLISKIRLSLFLIFERPPIKPKIFAREEDALLWLIEQVDTN
jgi:hypothetical protein